MDGLMGLDLRVVGRGHLGYTEYQKSWRKFRALDKLILSTINRPKTLYNKYREIPEYFHEGLDPVSLSTDDLYFIYNLLLNQEDDGEPELTQDFKEMYELSKGNRTRFYFYAWN